MRYEIYQIEDVANCPYTFRGSDILCTMNCFPNIVDYKKVDEGTLFPHERKTPEETATFLYHWFQRVDDDLVEFDFRSISVSDVIKTKWEEQGNVYVSYLYCDSIGWFSFAGFEEDKKTQAERLWKLLDDIPIDEDECIDTDFMCFEKGTHREEIWHWFEDTFNVSVAIDLMELD